MNSGWCRWIMVTFVHKLFFFSVMCRVFANILAECTLINMKSLKTPKIILLHLEVADFFDFV